MCAKEKEENFDKMMDNKIIFNSHDSYHLVVNYLVKKAPAERVLMEKKAFDFRPSDFGQGF